MKVRVSIVGEETKVVILRRTKDLGGGGGNVNSTP